MCHKGLAERGYASVDWLIPNFRCQATSCRLLGSSLVTSIGWVIRTAEAGSGGGEERVGQAVVQKTTKKNNPTCSELHLKLQHSQDHLILPS